MRLTNKAMLFILVLLPILGSMITTHAYAGFSSEEKTSASDKEAITSYLIKNILSPDEVDSIHGEVFESISNEGDHYIVKFTAKKSLYIKHENLNKKDFDYLKEVEFKQKEKVKKTIIKYIVILTVIASLVVLFVFRF